MDYILKFGEFVDNIFGISEILNIGSSNGPNNGPQIMSSDMIRKSTRIDVMDPAVTKKDRRDFATNYAYTNAELFLSQDNVDYICKRIYYIHKDRNGQNEYRYFASVVPPEMAAWAKKRDINNFTELAMTEINIINYINKRFISENEQLFMNNLARDSNFIVADSGVMEFNVYKGNAIIDGYDANGHRNYQVKPYKDMLASDMEQIRVWEPTSIEMNSGHFRDHNRIQKDQISRHARNVDRDNRGQGLKTDDPEIASLNNPIRGFNMELIYAAHGLEPKKFDIIEPKYNLGDSLELDPYGGYWR